MIRSATGDILQADAEALVNTVNCVGVMGRGIALQFKKEFPQNFREYKRACDAGTLGPGRMLVVPLEGLQGPRFVINFPTKRHWKGKSRIEDVHAGLAALVDEVRRHKIRSIAIPPLGCGLGGLDWRQVRPLIEQAFEPLPDVDVLLYEPAGAPAAEAMAKTAARPNMTAGRAALIGLMRRYLAAVMDPFTTLLELHKLMYFMQEGGEPLRLEYKKALYGPYAENLRHVLSRIEGHYIVGYGDATDDPHRRIELQPGAVEEAEEALQAAGETRERFDRVARLIEGFETPYGMELLATVHWVAQREGYAADDVIAGVHAWSERKRMFPGRHILLARDALRRQGWLPETDEGADADTTGLQGASDRKEDA